MHRIGRIRINIPAQQSSPAASREPQTQIPNGNATELNGVPEVYIDNADAAQNQEALPDTPYRSTRRPEQARAESRRFSMLSFRTDREEDGHGPNNNPAVHQYPTSLSSERGSLARRLSILKLNSRASEQKSGISLRVTNAFTRGRKGSSANNKDLPPAPDVKRRQQRPATNTGTPTPRSGPGSSQLYSMSFFRRLSFPNLPSTPAWLDSLPNSPHQGASLKAPLPPHGDQDEASDNNNNEVSHRSRFTISG